jgi:hypothetical protein
MFLKSFWYFLKNNTSDPEKRELCGSWIHENVWMTIKEKLRLKNSDSSKFVFNILAGQQGFLFWMTVLKLALRGKSVSRFYQIP